MRKNRASVASQAKVLYVQHGLAFGMIFVPNGLTTAKLKLSLGLKISNNVFLNNPLAPLGELANIFTLAKNYDTIIIK